MASSLVSTLAFGQTILVQYVELILFIIGTVGSLLNILLFSQKKFRLNSCCIYFLAASISTIIMLFVGIIPQIYALKHTPSPIFNRDFCKARTYLAQISAMLCRWLLIIACIDRCLLTSTDARLRRFTTVPIAQKLVLVFCIIWILIPIHVLIFADVRKLGYIICMMSTDTMAIYHNIYTITSGGILPPLIMLICAKILWKSLQAKRHRRELIQGRQRRNETQNTQILIMLLLQVVIFIVFTLPYMSSNLYFAFTRSVTNKSADRLAIESFVNLFTEVVVFVYPAFTFYSNTLVSRTFRNELLVLVRRILTSVCGQRFYRIQRIHPSTFTITRTHRPNNLPMIPINKD
ncbi:unnamed protein product [Adineta ricciae]|uniref:G-protein coupled receptors family 1 profile domain-containing protein n=1 Tax=Adineta ricciae TaxID=249248 RepID=A0A815R315_ADIRI|nr:unnamed protein product [Adineta ricciae]CAF1471469.1 unnamed protein product [Adineta ricciae]